MMGATIAVWLNPASPDNAIVCNRCFFNIDAKQNLCLRNTAKLPKLNIASQLEAGTKFPLDQHSNNTSPSQAQKQQQQPRLICPVTPSTNRELVLSNPQPLSSVKLHSAELVQHDLSAQTPCPLLGTRPKRADLILGVFFWATSPVSSLLYSWYPPTLTQRGTIGQWIFIIILWPMATGGRCLKERLSLQIFPH